MKTIPFLFATLFAAAAPALADDHGNTLSTATTIVHRDTPGVLETNTDQDWFKLVVTVPGRHWIYTIGGTDTKGTLYSATGSSIVSFNGGGSLANFEIERSLTAGTYYLKVEGGGTIAGSGPYTLHVRSPQFSTVLDQPNTQGVLTEPGEILLYRLVSPADGTHWFYTTGTTDTSAVFLAENGASLVTNNSGGVSQNFLFNRSLTAGSVHFLMVRVGSESSPGGPFTLSWRNAAFSVPFQGTRRDASIGVPGDLDLYRIEVASMSNVWIFSTGDTDTAATLYGNSWNSIETNNSGGANQNFLIGRKLAAGRYWLLVESGTAAAVPGPYTLHVRQAATATVLPASGALDRLINVPGDLDLFAFSTGGGAVSLSSSGATDVAATLYDSNGNAIATNDNGGGPNFLIERTLTAGTYHLLVSGSNLGLHAGPYRLHAAFPAGGSVSALSSASSHLSGTGSVVVEVSSNGPWSVSGLPSWITASQPSGSGNASVSFSLAPNLTGAPREATVTIAGIAHRIAQYPAGDPGGPPQEPALAIHPAVILSIETTNGVRYRIETSVDLHRWEDTGIEFTGNGFEMSCAIERTQARAFFRAVAD